jgi:hypothetical protein
LFLDGVDCKWIWNYKIFITNKSSWYVFCCVREREILKCSSDPTLQLVAVCFVSIAFAYVTAEGATLINGSLLYATYALLAIYLRWQVAKTGARYNAAQTSHDASKRAKLRVFGDVVLVYVGGTVVAGVLLQLAHADTLLIGRALFRLTIETLHLVTIAALCWAFRLQSLETPLPR